MVIVFLWSLKWLKTVVVNKQHILSQKIITHISILSLISLYEWALPYVTLVYHGAHNEPNVTPVYHKLASCYTSVSTVDSHF